MYPFFALYYEKGPTMLGRGQPLALNYVNPDIGALQQLWESQAASQGWSF